MACTVLEGVVDIFDFSHTQTVGTRCDLKNERARQGDWDSSSQRAGIATLIVIIFAFPGPRTGEVSGYEKTHMEMNGIKPP